MTRLRGWRTRGAAVVLAGGLLTGCGSAAASAPAAPPASMGNSIDLPVPAAISNLPLTDSHGHRTDLAAFHGRVLVLAPFLTSCQEECPLTTGAFLSIQHDLDAGGLSSQVTLAELTMDPGRDRPARLAAYEAFTGADSTLLTASPAVVDAVWRHFGIYHQVVPEDSPAGIDWQTGRPYTYDLQHSNGFIVFDRTGRERFITINFPDLHGQIAGRVRRLLSAEGLQNLVHADPNQTWTVSQALQAIGHVLGREIPEAP